MLDVPPAVRRGVSLFKTLTLITALFCAVPAFASITLDAVSSASAAAGTSTFSFNHVLGAGGNRLVVCTVALSTPSGTITQFYPTVTFGNVPMTPIAQSPGSSQNTPRVEGVIYWAVDSSPSSPAGSTLASLSGSTSVTVAVTNTAPAIVAGCSSYFGVNQTGSIPESSGVSYSGTGTVAAAIPLTVSAVGDLVVDGIVGGYTGGSTAKTVVPNTPQVLNYGTALSASGVFGGSSYEIATASGTISPSWAAGSSSPSRTTYSAAAFSAAASTNYSLTTIASPAGSGTFNLSPSGGSYASGTSVSITANPAIGYVFSSFSGAITGTTNPSSVVINGPTTVTGNFVSAPCTLTTATSGSGSGTVMLSPAGGTYACGTSVQVTAVPNSGSSFGNFSGALTGTTNPQTVVLNTSSTVTATFVLGSTCTLSTSTTGSGTITVSPSGTSFSCGTSLTITAVPAQYYSLTGFSGSITGTTNPQTYIINSNSTISAAFAQTSYPINTTIVGPGTVTANPADSGTGYTPGTQVTLTATPSAGASFTGFSGALTGTTNPQTLTIASAAPSVTATFVASVITKDAVSHGVSSGTAANTISWQHILGAGSSRAVVIAVGTTNSPASPDPAAVVTSVLFNGVYATPVPGSIAYTGTSGNVQAQLFYLLESELPAAGTYTITATLAGSVEGIQGGAISFFGVSQGPAEAVIVHKDGSGADLISTAITTLTPNAAVVDMVEDNTVVAAGLTPNAGQNVIFTAPSTLGTGGNSYKFTPTPGSTTLGWAGSASRLVHTLVSFAPATSTIPATYALTTSIAGGVGGTVSANPGLSQYPVSTGVLLTANAAVGYTFASWSGDYTSTANPLPITMDTARNVVANFTSVATCTLTINIVGSGTVTPAAGVYNCGTVIHFVATPATGYTFTSYSGDFNTVDNPADFTISANSNVTVEFDPIATCSLTITANNGSVSPGSGSYTCGTTVKLQATANSGYAFSGYTGDISTTANPATVQLNQNTNITANFTQGSACALTTSITSGSGTISPSSGSWACGTVIAIEADAAAKYTFSGWGGALAGSVTSPTTLTMSTNQTVTATFAPNTSGVTGDTRTVTEPSYPPVCTVLTAVQTAGSLVETSPDTTRIQNALNACPSGQAVEFSSNGTANAFIIQPIVVPAGVTMLVDPEVTIFASINSTDYPCTSSSFCKPVINIAQNTAPNPGSGIMGLGIIDGRGGVPLTDKGKSWWGTGSDQRPRLVFLSSNTNTLPSDNFTMYKITLKDGPKFEMTGIGNNLTVWDVKVIAPPDSPNTDGIDPSSSQNITITNSFISTGDDMIAFKAGNGHIANVTVSNSHFYSGHGITVGSETNAGLNNMLVIGDAIDNGFGGSSLDSLRIKSDTSRGGEVYDVLYKNICIKNGGDTIVIDPYYSSETGTLIPNFHDITFQNVHKLVHNSSYKSTWTGYNTNGIINPLTVTLDTVYFDGDAQNDFKAPDNVNNVQFTFGPGPVSAASFFTVDAATPSNFVTVTNSVTNSNAALDCSNAFVYLAGDITAATKNVTAGTSPKVTLVLQNVVSPYVAGTITYPQQNAPTGTVQLLEGSTVVGSATLSGRLAYVNVPNITAGTHNYTANYLGDSHYGAQAFGSYTLIATNPAPVANSQTVSVPFNTAMPITLTATGLGTLTYSVIATPTHGMLSGTAPSLTYTPTSGYVGADSFTFKVNNGTDSNIATVTINVQSGGGTTPQSITFNAPASPVTYGAAAINLGATASSGLAVLYNVTGPATLNGYTLSFTGQGTVIITATQPGNTTYAAATSVQQSIIVNAAPLTVSVSGTPSRYFGQPNPSFAYNIAPFVSPDTQNTATTGAPAITTAAVPRSPSGTYPITVSIGTLAAANYIFNLVNSQLTVSGGAAQTISFAPLANFTHGSSIPLVASSSSGLPVSFNVTNGNANISGGNTLNITGTGSITVTATQAGDGDFAAATPVARVFIAQ